MGDEAKLAQMVVILEDKVHTKDTRITSLENAFKELRHAVEVGGATQEVGFDIPESLGTGS